MTRPRPPVHMIVPEGIDDPRHPSGGNVYDRRVLAEFDELGRVVREIRVPGAWPDPGPVGHDTLSRRLAEIPDQATILVDGLIGSAAPVLAAETGRLHVVVLVHMPLAEAHPYRPVAQIEGRVLRAASAVITTSRWARDWLLGRHQLPADRVHIAEPGADREPLAAGTDGARSFLCVGPVTPDKGQGELLEALARIETPVGLPAWQCTLAGALDLAPDYVQAVKQQAHRLGLAERISFTGPLTPGRLERQRDQTDLTISVSRRESYGMSLTESLARGIPVIATDVGGQPEAIGPGSASMLVPPGRPDRLTEALQRWLTDQDHRARLRQSAQRRRDSLPTWRDTAETIGEVLDRCRHDLDRGRHD